MTNAASPVARRCNRRGLAKPVQGGKSEGLTGRSLLQTRQHKVFTCHGECYPAEPLIRLAVRSTPSPVWEKAFLVMHYARNLTVLPNYRSQPSLIFAINAPVARRGNRRGLAKPGHRGKSEESPGWSLLRTERFKFFPATGAAGGRQCRLPVLFKQLSCHTQVLCFFLDSRKKRNPRPPYRFSTTLPPLWMQLAGTVPRTLTRGYTCAPRPMTAPGLSTAPQPISA